MALSDMLTSLFAHICGQGRCFVIDGQALPVCQRCLGLYVGAGITVAWLAFSGLWRRGLPGGWTLAVQAALLLAAGLGGLHVIDAGPRWRLACGLWTGWAVTCWLVGGSVCLWRYVRAAPAARDAGPAATDARPGRRGLFDAVQALAIPASMTLAAAFWDYVAAVGWWPAAGAAAAGAVSLAIIAAAALVLVLASICVAIRRRVA